MNEEEIEKEIERLIELESKLMARGFYQHMSDVSNQKFAMYDKLRKLREGK